MGAGGQTMRRTCVRQPCTSSGAVKMSVSWSGLLHDNLAAVGLKAIARWKMPVCLAGGMGP